MFSTIVHGLRAWRVSLFGMVIAGLLLGVPFASNPGSQCYAKGGGHHAKGHKARSKRHGKKRHHSRHHLAKTHRHAKRREHHSHTSHSTDVSHHTNTTDISHTTDIAHHHNAWGYYWGHHGYVVPDVVEPDVVTPSVVTTPVVVPTVVGTKVFFVKLYAPKDRRNHIEEVAASTDDKVKERVLEKYADADFKSIDLKPADSEEDVYVVKFDTPGDQNNHIEDVLASTGDKAKEQILEKNAGATVTKVEVKPVINGH